jgi:RimJ/RimL family protein N-acetyltransferase
MNRLTVRDLFENDIALIISYWGEASPEFLQKMGVDAKKLPSSSKRRESLLQEMSRPDEKKSFHNFIWEIDDTPVGYSTLKRLKYESEADIHLHMWAKEFRAKGYGRELFQRTLQVSFQRFKLNRIICEPSSTNPAPNKLLQSLGHKVVKIYRTIPSDIALEMEVNRYEIRHVGTS